MAGLAGEVGVTCQLQNPAPKALHMDFLETIQTGFQQNSLDLTSA